MNIDVYNTSIQVSPYTKGLIPQVENLYTAYDKYSNTIFPCGYLIEKNILYLPRGTSITNLEEWIGDTIWSNNNVNYNHKSDPSSKMSRKHFANTKPRDDLQEDAIEFLTTCTNHQIALNVYTGAGKNFMSIYSASKLNIKTIIITHSDRIKLQWYKTCTEMFDYTDNEILDINGSPIIENIMKDKIPSADIYLVNHQTLRNYLSSHGTFLFHNFFKKLKVGIKIYDESHLEFQNILLVDSFTNTNRTWYLTATFDRSDDSESKCFKQAFSSISIFDGSESNKKRKHVEYLVFYMNSHINPFQLKKLTPYGKGMSSITYGKYAFYANDVTYQSIKLILEKLNHLEGKRLIFVPLIDAVDKITKKLRLDFPDLKIGAFHSKVSASEKLNVLKGNIIVSTIKSCGTGMDIPGLRVVICAEPYASKVLAQQVIGRLRPYSDDTYTYFVDLVDISIPAIMGWFRVRFRVIKNLVNSVKYLNME